MPVERFPVDAELEDFLARICERFGFATTDEALAYLVKRRLRRGAARIVGRGRALYPVKRENPNE